MEKEKHHSNLKSRILKILPKAAAVTFQNPPFSPGRDHKFKSNGGKGFFSGPMIPDEARRKPRHGGVETQEPTSPKISCMGQIKHKKKRVTKGSANTVLIPPRARDSTPTEEKKQASKLQRMFFHTGKPKPPGRKKSVAVTDTAPPLGHMRRFASGRETFSNFDWKAQIAPEERDCYSDYDDRVESDAEDEILIPFSAPIMVGGGGGGAASVPNVQPRKEINLWKRRTMAPPRPLQLNPLLTAK